MTCGTPSIDNAGGQAVFYCATIPLFGAPGLATTEPVVMARSLFQALEPGESVIGLADSVLTGPNGEEIEPALAAGHVTVRQPPPTETPEEPTSTPEPPTPPASTETPAPEPTPTSGALGAEVAVTPPPAPTSQNASTFSTPRALVSVTAAGVGSESPADGSSGTLLVGLLLALGGLGLAGGAVALRKARRES